MVEIRLFNSLILEPMNMNTNLTQHPCAGKCTEFKEEQCSTCLVSFEPNADFLPGDVVVLKTLDLLSVTDLFTLKGFNGEFWHTDHRIGRVSGLVIRTATVAELKAKRRLDPPVALFVSEVS